MDDPRPEAENGAAEPRHPQPDTPTTRVRCAAVLPPGRDEPGELREAMRRRGVEMVCFSDVYAALRGVLEGAGAQALVFVDPASLPNDQASRLTRALAKRIERLTLWSYDSGDGLPARLHPYAPIDTSPARDWSPPPTPPPPRLRLAGFHDEPEEDAGGEPAPRDPSDAPPSELLTSEEIAMLLDDGPESREENKA